MLMGSRSCTVARYNFDEAVIAEDRDRMSIARHNFKRASGLCLQFVLTGHFALLISSRLLSGYIYTFSRFCVPERAHMSVEVALVTSLCCLELKCGASR